MDLISAQQAFRFGFGLPQDSVIGTLAAADRQDILRPLEKLEQRQIRVAKLVRLQRARKKDEALLPAFKKHRRSLVGVIEQDFLTTVRRCTFGDEPFRERLSLFWTDHFTVATPNLAQRAIQSTIVQEAIRPNLNGSFAELLKAAVLHPAMLLYLDQVASVGPNSIAGKRRRRGLNENLAREILELHSLGVNGPYSQEDVVQFAELLTGLFYSFKRGRQFLPVMAEPGLERVLGKIYGHDPARLSDIFDALDDIALHPETAKHIATKLAVHFVSVSPPSELVEELTRTYTNSGGVLSELYDVLLHHPLSLESYGSKIRQPIEFLCGALRGLEVDEQDLINMKRSDLRAMLLTPLTLMGQNFRLPKGPDGWPEDAASWITPQGLASRIQWAMAVPTQLAQAQDPRLMVDTILGPLASKKTRWAVTNAESRSEGIGLIFASPEFNRR